MLKSKIGGMKAKRDDLLARSGATAFHEDRTVRNINIKEMHFPVGGFDFTRIGKDDMAIIHVTLIRANFLQRLFDLRIQSGQVTTWVLPPS